MTLFSQKELLIVTIIVSVLLIVIGYLTILDIRDYFKKKKGISKEESCNDSQDVLDIEEIDVDSKKTTNTFPAGSLTEVLEEIEIIDFDEPVSIEESVNNEVITSEENIIEVPVSITKEEAKAELERVTMELSNVDNKDPFEDTITNFELEQEENAIISLDELVKISDNLYDSNEVMQYDEGNEPITIDEVINKFNTNVEGSNVNVVESDQVIPFNIYGYENNSNEMQFENTANYEKFDIQSRKNNDFLNSLKEMHEKHEN